ncbi:DUF4240 domain-containing protein [Alienimonas californiensis]|uniref:DUF4240 domain-containing protein n=1 Tax=Alienimonas californiensis TaxID=2527989 RepID=A0A517P9U2_9PLAN|nr:DUF4240 domain-containing protein [Alienimonas californiensis]QDT16139.1 hypothetical protein CA12_22370 [Alienimonas californiensis]
MDEIRFWQMIDVAWDASPANAAFRTELEAAIGDEAKRDAFVQRYFDEHNLGAIPEEDVFVEALQDDLASLSREELIAFDRILEQKLYDIDREEVHEATDGSDDGFLYCRGFIVACGQAFYEAVDRVPENALCEFFCEEMCYLPQAVFEERFDEEFPASDVSRESCSNTGAWPSLDQ